MLICHTINEIKSFTRQAASQGKTIGFVPTMGYFHAGHLALMSEAKKTCSVVVSSIFVNPVQFGPQEDFTCYPRDIDRDKRLAVEVGVDAIFIPSVEEMYPPRFSTFVETKKITDCLCGKSRPGHFQGVTTVVTKLFNIIQPDIAFFGQKDFQQAATIRRMAEDLNLKVKIVLVPTVRDKDGLALSSRNIYLEGAQRQAALSIPKSLALAAQAVENGERDPIKVKMAVCNMLAAEPLVEIDYIEIYSLPHLEEISLLQGEVLLAIAAKVGKTRLIDNLVLKIPDNWPIIPNKR
ncbi:pantoate--beta-alanine ligase [Peptococcaceae bacterium SCADC1_2_3]|nr:pantoate--beta-alanine ligase [Peptococcaceae bacterium SCADC1_2_3]KFI36273.1 pantoate--beta-alanine ligase [Peptococcaceae bacterium SCADC1_2_3]KFI37610.1 pantoate--beta-alanine ligase [Peptococcaceae bacterium SCADC1_2_3]HBQ27816.1 pantoate--beta-alanine ligase [Desulfotomaculum sp.]